MNIKSALSRISCLSLTFVVEYPHFICFVCNCSE